MSSKVTLCNSIIMILLAGLCSTSTKIVASAFSPSSLSSPVSSRATKSLLFSSSTSAATPFVKGESIVIRDTKNNNNLPTVYVYDHCPFCVRVRMALGIKNIKHTIQFLANDDSIIPISLVGKKVAPIFTFDTIIMPESLDIIQYIDTNDVFGTINQIQPFTDRTDLKEWQNSVKDILRRLQRPRYVATGLLPEFQQYDSRVAFINNHEINDYTKDIWKKSNTLSLETKIQLYNELLGKDPTDDIQLLNTKLIELDSMIYSPYYCSQSTNGISYDDIDLFSRLRSITIIKNVSWPTKLRSYMNYMSELSDVPLYDTMAM